MNSGRKRNENDVEERERDERGLIRAGTSERLRAALSAYSPVHASTMSSFTSLEAERSPGRASTIRKEATV